MRLALLAFASALPAASSALPAASPPTAAPAQHRLADNSIPSRLCRDALKERPIRSPDAVGPKRLGELPSGDLTLAVLNRVGDCIEPVTIRQGFGAMDGRPGR